jgi:hypothetical protein
MTRLSHHVVGLDPAGRRRDASGASTSWADRALVRARWDAAQRVGTPALVTQAQAASRPILERLGFRATAVIKVLVDRPAGVSPV